MKIKETQILSKFKNQDILNEIEIILPKSYSYDATQSLTNSFELAIYKNQIDNIKLHINNYQNKEDLEKIVSLKAIPGKIFIGTLGEKETEIVKKYCNMGILFFSFSSNKKNAGDCVYLINFFPSDDLNALFKFFPNQSKIALLYPENFYGFKINSLIDEVALKNQLLIINRASYKEDLSNAREAIKKLSKYQLRKNELNQQKLILNTKDDEASKGKLKQIKKLETLGEVDFTHIIVPDYGIRLLEIIPLLPFYDVDPKKVQFVGTGVWDDNIFFFFLSLQGAIFPGIEINKRSNFFDDYFYVFNERPMRTDTIPYDIIGLLSYFFREQLKLNEVFKFLNNSQIKFEGMDGKFYFLNNVIFRELNILKIENGKAKKIK